MREESAKTVLRKKIVGRFTLFDLKICFKDAVVKAVWCWSVDRQINGWNRIESHRSIV